MAPEPSHLVNILKTCPRCNNTDDIKFMYLNNNKPTQPRYKCNGEQGCGDFFTYGGRIRAPRVVRPRVARPRKTSTTSTAVVAADRCTGPARRGRPRRITRQSGAQEIQETPATCARTEARIVATCARTEARTVATCAPTEARTVAAETLARPTTGALGLPRIPISEQRESSVQSPVPSSVKSSVENQAVLGPVPTACIAGLVPGDVVDADQRTASRPAATVIAQGDVAENWTKAVLGVSPYGLAPASSGKRMKVVRIKYDGKESVVPFWA